MRRLSTEDTYFYFKKRYISERVMLVSFRVTRNQDKEKQFKNKKYLVQSVWGYFDYQDIMEMLRYEEEVNNTIVYAQQLVIDLEALIIESGAKGKLGKLAKLIGIPQQMLSRLNISYNTALKIINNIETKLNNMSIEAIQDLKVNYQKLSA